MISWIQNTFQKHFRIVFLVLLAVMTISLVSIYSASGGLGRGRDTVKPVELFGVQLSSDSDIAIFDQAGAISLQLSTGYPQGNNLQVRIRGLQRAAALQLADKYGIPQPTTAQLQAFIERLAVFQDQEGKYSAQKYADFRNSLRFGQRGQEDFIANIIKEDWRIAQIENALGGPGYVLDSEINQTLEFADTKWAVDTAVLDLSKAPAPASPSEDEIQKWFEGNAARYQTQPRVRVSYVAFPAARYINEVKLTDEQIVSYFEKNKARYRKPAPTATEGEPAPTPTEPTLEEARPDVVRDLTLVAARNIAARKAADFAYALFERKIQRGMPEFERLLIESGTTLVPAPAFSRTTPPAGLGWSAAVVNEAFRLSEKRPVSDPIEATSSAVLLFFDESIAAGPAQLADVRDTVVKELTQSLRQSAYQAEGQAVHTRLVDAMQAGKTFAEAAAASGLEVKSWQDFTARTPPADLDRTVIGDLNTMTVGEIAPMAVRGTRGTFVHLAAKQVPEPVSSGPEFEEMRAMIMSQTSGLLSGSMLTDLASAELKNSGIADRLR